MGDADFAPCKKCTKQIPTDASRCPNCGYEPAVGSGHWRTLVLVFAVGVFFAPIAILGFFYGVLGLFIGALVGLGLTSPLLLAVIIAVLRERGKKPTTHS